MKTIAIMFRTDPEFARCRSCRQVNVLKRSHSRNWREAAVKNFLFLKTYRCRSCGWRGIIPTFTISSAALKSFLYYILIAAAAGFIAFQILKRFF
jgi:hypothetical protein